MAASASANVRTQGKLTRGAGGVATRAVRSAEALVYSGSRLTGGCQLQRKENIFRRKWADEDRQARWEQAVSQSEQSQLVARPPKLEASSSSDSEGGLGFHGRDDGRIHAWGGEEVEKVDQVDCNRERSPTKRTFRAPGKIKRRFASDSDDCDRQSAGSDKFLDADEYLSLEGLMLSEVPLDKPFFNAIPVDSPPMGERVEDRGHCWSFPAHA